MNSSWDGEVINICEHFCDASKCRTIKEDVDTFYLYVFQRLHATWFQCFLEKYQSLFLFNFLIGRKLLYNIVLVSAIQQYKPIIIILVMRTSITSWWYISPPSWSSLPSLHPTPLGHYHRASGWAPCITQKLLTSYLFNLW